MDKPKTPGVIKLSEPLNSQLSLERALIQRRSVRSFSDVPLTLAEISQLLWSAQGITNYRGFRTAPSAGALFPLEIFLAAGDVNSLSPGIYKYEPVNHELRPVETGDKRAELSRAAYGQSPIAKSPASFVLTGVYERTTRKYGERGVRYVHLEVGHVAQNLCLQAVALNLATVVIGAFNDEDTKNLIGAAQNEAPLYIIPVGAEK